jgi:NADPH-ferrihemoprotein reductase
VQKSRNSRLKDLEDRSSTNIYCTNIPIDWTEAVRQESCSFAYSVTNLLS